MKRFRPLVLSWTASVALGILALSGPPSGSTVYPSTASVSEDRHPTGSLVLQQEDGRSRVQPSSPRPAGVFLGGKIPETYGSYETRMLDQSQTVGTDAGVGPSQPRQALTGPLYLAHRAAIARGGFLSSPSRAPPPSLR